MLRFDSVMRNHWIQLIATFFLVVACSLPIGSIQNVSQTSQPQSGPSQGKFPTQKPLSAKTAQNGSQSEVTQQRGLQTSVMKSFPLAPSSQMDQSDSNGPTDHDGSFTIHSQSTIQALIAFYTGELPKQGWTLRYTDANLTGGVTQKWKKDNIYLSLDFTFKKAQLTIQGQYQRVEPQDAQKLPKDFPLPAQAEMTRASDTDWDFYIPQDYAAVTSFLTQKISALNWQQSPLPGSGGQGGCGGDCGGEAPNFPAGVTAMPTATNDPRKSADLSFTMPNGNGIELNIIPHQTGTILLVTLTIKNLDSSDFPKDIPVYPGATVQMITSGTASFAVHADVSTIKNFYIEKLKAAGWTQDGDPVETQGGYYQKWKNGGRNISISLVPSGKDTDMAIYW